MALLAVSVADAVPKLLPGWNVPTVVAGVGVGALLLRRRWPLLALLLGVPSMVYAGLQIAPAILLAHFADRRHGVVPVVVVTAAVVVAGVAYWWYSGPGALPINLQSITYLAGFVGGASLLGRLLRVRRQQQEQLTALRESRAREHLLVEESARAAERSELAREMHDVVSHQVSLIAVQAGALRVTGGTPEQVSQVAETIRTLAVQTNDELRQVLGALRSQDVAASLNAQHDLADITGLWEAAEVAGEFTLPTAEEARAVPPAVQRAAYRIAQEALTNVRKHAHGARVRLCVSLTPPWETATGPSRGALTLTVVNVAPPGNRPVPDGGTAAAAIPGGAGLIGVGERVGWLGGTVESGPTPEGGYRLRVWLPLAVRTTS